MFKLYGPYGNLRDPDPANKDSGGGDPADSANAPNPADPKKAPAPTGGSAEDRAELEHLRRLKTAQRVLADANETPERQDQARRFILKDLGHSDAQIDQWAEEARNRQRQEPAPPRKGPKKPGKAAAPESEDDGEEATPEEDPSFGMQETIAELQAQIEELRGGQKETEVERLKTGISTATDEFLNADPFLQKILKKKSPEAKGVAMAKIQGQIRARTVAHLRTMQGQSGSSKVPPAWVGQAVKKATAEISGELQAVLDGLDLGLAPETDPEVTTILARPKPVAKKFKEGDDAELMASDYTANTLERLAAEQMYSGSKA